MCEYIKGYMGLNNIWKMQPKVNISMHNIKKSKRYTLYKGKENPKIVRKWRNEREKDSTIDIGNSKKL